MAFVVNRTIPLNAVRVISPRDDALDKAKSDIDAYKETLDESKLTFIEGKQPTVFLCNFRLGMRDARTIKNSMMTSTDEGKPTVGLGSWQIAVVKSCLKDIINPDYVPAAQRLEFKQAKDGKATDDLVAELEEFGVVDDIFAYFSVLTKKGGDVDEAKN